MERDIAIDYLRSSVTVAVVVHHSALAYNTFSYYDSAHCARSAAPIVDTVRFAPLDALVGWKRHLLHVSYVLYFRPLRCAVHGAKGVGRFLADRTKRLGIPFVIAATLLAPIAYYPSWLLSDSVSQGGFLSRFFTTDKGSAGRAWFIWVLLAFCVVVAIAYRFTPDLMKKLSWSPKSAGNLVFVVLAVTLIATIPMQVFLAPGEWFRVAGPLYFPASRSILYFVWFLLALHSEALTWSALCRARI